ncbi:hypothetical protein RHO12_03080 [Orbus sturtevantii]|uniref:hypothetical protein n=1 Tax=Orbus sturtevantii TaxID=3074109 RepID=UPI00370DE240
MKNLKFIFLSAILVSFFAQSNLNPKAPLGLTWGEKKEQIENNYDSKKMRQKDNLTFYNLYLPPLTLPDFTEYLAIVDNDIGLVKVILSQKIKNDAYGIKGKELYFKYKNVLTKKYNEPTQSMEKIGNRLYKGSDEFYQCLKYNGCGLYISLYGNPKTQVVLRLVGAERGVGELQISYESELFDQSIKNVKNK